MLYFDIIITFFTLFLKIKNLTKFILKYQKEIDVMVEVYKLEKYIEIQEKKNNKL